MNFDELIERLSRPAIVLDVGGFQPPDDLMAKLQPAVVSGRIVPQ